MVRYLCGQIIISSFTLNIYIYLKQGHAQLSALRCKGNFLLQRLGRKFPCMLLILEVVSPYGFAAAVPGNTELCPLEILGNEGLSEERARRVLRERNLFVLDYSLCFR